MQKLKELECLYGQVYGKGGGGVGGGIWGSTPKFTPGVYLNFCTLLHDPILR